VINAAGGGYHNNDKGKNAVTNRVSELPKKENIAGYHN